MPLSISPTSYRNDCHLIITGPEMIFLCMSSRSEEDREEEGVSPGVAVPPARGHQQRPRGAETPCLDSPLRVARFRASRAARREAGKQEPLTYRV